MPVVDVVEHTGNNEEHPQQKQNSDDKSRIV
jgi:hypothetical protein